MVNERVRYAHDYSWFDVRALNEKGKEYLNISGEEYQRSGKERLSREKYVELLWHTRGMEMPDSIRNKIISGEDVKELSEAEMPPF